MQAGHLRRRVRLYLASSGYGQKPEEAILLSDVREVPQEKTNQTLAGFRQPERSCSRCRLCFSACLTGSRPRHASFRPRPSRRSLSPPLNNIPCFSGFLKFIPVSVEWNAQRRRIRNDGVGAALGFFTAFQQGPRILLRRALTQGRIADKI